MVRGKERGMPLLLTKNAFHNLFDSQKLKWS